VSHKSLGNILMRCVNLIDKSVALVCAVSWPVDQLTSRLVGQNANALRAWRGSQKWLQNAENLQL